uniref:Uncharacterized protein n=2 Tax=Opuntia streptacantha TaxID=393608 RepID=A0A7C9DCB8_OPUST
MNPFGTPITDETLKAMPQYIGKDITQEDRAREAMRLIHAEDKNINALSHAVDLKHDYGNGVSTLCLIYNATGGPLQLVDKNDWYGQVYKEEPPRSFDNGQWLAFLHVHPTSQAIGSEAARVLRGSTVDGDVRDYMVAWCTRWGAAENNVSTYQDPHLFLFLFFWFASFRQRKHIFRAAV